jgi:hypothetical protein
LVNDSARTTAVMSAHATRAFCRFLAVAQQGQAEAAGGDHASITWR